MHLRNRSLKRAIVLALSFACQQLVGQAQLSFELYGNASVQTQPWQLYQPEASADLTSWAPFGGWFIGDGSEQAVARPLEGDALFVRMQSSELIDLSAALETLRIQQQLPAVAVAIIQDGRLSAIGATGTRRFGTDAPVTLADRWHHGSLTKSMTATLAAILVEEGLIGWETTLGSVFPDKAASMSGQWSSVTLRQLLANAAGAPGDIGSIWTQLWNFNGLPQAGRQLLLDLVTAQPLRFAPGGGYEYSNAGFALAGAMLEQVAGEPWESLMQQHLFGSLHMQSSGFGVPATPRHLDHPVGHSGNAANPTIWDPGTNADNPAAIGPAATVHASMADMVRYVQAHLRGARGEIDSPLPAAAWDTLHTPAFGNQYALGWFVLNRPWAGGDALQHTGSNTQWYTNVWIAPNVNWACIVCTNFGGTNAFQKTDAIVGWALTNYGP